MKIGLKLTKCIYNHKIKKISKEVRVKLVVLPALQIFCFQQ